MNKKVLFSLISICMTGSAIAIPIFEIKINKVETITNNANIVVEKYVTLNKKIPTSAQVFLTWCNEWKRRNDNNLPNIIDYLKQINFEINNLKSISKIELKSFTTLSSTQGFNKFEINLEFNVILNSGSVENDSIKLGVNDFEPNINLPKTINLLKNDFFDIINSLNHDEKEINKFLRNRGFLSNFFISKVIFTNVEKINDNNIRLEFIQFKTGDKKITSSVDVNLKNILFKKHISQDPVGIIGIIFGIILLISLITYFSFKLKWQLEKNKNKSEVIPAWEVKKDADESLIENNKKHNFFETLIVEGKNNRKSKKHNKKNKN